MTIASGTYLFLGASRQALLDGGKKSDSEADTGTPAKRKKSPDKDQNVLDIQAVAQKIGRRVKVSGDPSAWGENLLKMLVSELEIMSGMLFFQDQKGDFSSVASYAVPHSNLPQSFKAGEGLPGQAVQNKQMALYRELPESYANMLSGLGESKAGYLAIIPILKGADVVACLEVAGFRWKSERIDQLFNLIVCEISAKLEENSPTSKDQENRQKEGGNNNKGSDG